MESTSINVTVLGSTDQVTLPVKFLLFILNIISEVSLGVLSELYNIACRFAVRLNVLAFSPLIATE